MAVGVTVLGPVADAAKIVSRVGDDLVDAAGNIYKKLDGSDTFTDINGNSFKLDNNGDLVRVEMPDVSRTFDFASDTDDFVNDVINFNQTTDGGGNLFGGGDVHSILQSASYYDTPAEQGASIFRSIIKNHTFENGNKRTAVAAYKNFAQRTGIPINLTDNQLFDITLQVERNELVDVSDIANALR